MAEGGHQPGGLRATGEALPQGSPAEAPERSQSCFAVLVVRKDLDVVVVMGPSGRRGQSERRTV